MEMLQGGRVPDLAGELLVSKRLSLLLHHSGKVLHALVGNMDWIRTLSGGGAVEGAVEALDVHLTVAQLAIKRIVHSRYQFRAQFVEDLVDVDVRHAPSPKTLS